MMSIGELWHPRSKIYNGSTIKEISTFAGLYDDNKGIVGVDFDKFPDYLTSHYDRSRFDTEFKKFISKNEIFFRPHMLNIGDLSNKYLKINEIISFEKPAFPLFLKILTFLFERHLGILQNS